MKLFRDIRQWLTTRRAAQIAQGQRDEQAKRIGRLLRRTFQGGSI